MDQLLATGGTITLIHFVHPTLSRSDEQQWRIACMPNMTEFHSTPYHPNYQRTDDARAVTCPACKKAPVFKTAMTYLQEAMGRTASVR